MNTECVRCRTEDREYNKIRTIYKGNDVDAGKTILQICEICKLIILETENLVYGYWVDVDKNEQ